MKSDYMKSGFKIPGGYFEDLDSRLFIKMEEQNLPKGSGLKVPESYFSSLEEQVFSRMNPGNKVKPLFPSKWTLYASAVAACFIIGFILFKNFNQENLWKNVQISVIDEYIEEGNLNIDQYDLPYIIEPEILDNQEISDAGIPTSALENYLLENTDEEIFY